jgi:hypothetical protein
MADMSYFRADRRYWPSQLVDEVMPVGRRRAEDWLDPDDDGETIVLEGGEPVAHFSPGQTITFDWMEPRGHTVIELAADGSWSGARLRDRDTVDMFEGGQSGAPSEEPSAADRIANANWFAEASDYETMMDTMDAFARELAAMCVPDSDGSRVDVAMAFWSDTHETYLVSADGRALLSPPSPSEWNVLEMLAGEREWEHGAATNACLEALKGHGYATGLPYKINKNGRAALARRKAQADV